MPDAVRCPDCGHENPAGSASCSRCNYPLQEVAPGPGQPGAAEPEIVIRRPVRPRRPRPVANPNALFLWMFLGVVAAALLVWQAVDGFRKNNAVPVEGATVDQQRLADSLRTALARDTTNVDATIEYANVLYDTANWAEAAKYYARAIGRDSSRVMAIVDMGVCYYNQGNTARAEALFQLALAREPGQTVALFNLGIVNERLGESETALKYFHRSLEAGPPEEMKQQIVQHMQQILEKTGKKVPPLDPGAIPPGRPSGTPPAQPPPAGGTGS
jgi:tetratricopeptide (TPR) repeat protein